MYGHQPQRLFEGERGAALGEGCTAAAAHAETADPAVAHVRMRHYAAARPGEVVGERLDRIANTLAEQALPRRIGRVPAECPRPEFGPPARIRPHVAQLELDPRIESRVRYVVRRCAGVSGAEVDATVTQAARRERPPVSEAGLDEVAIFPPCVR